MCVGWLVKVIILFTASGSIFLLSDNLAGWQTFVAETRLSCSWPSVVLLSFLLYNNVEFSVIFTELRK